MIVSHLLLILHKKYSFISLCLKPEMWQKVAKFKVAEYFRKALYKDIKIWVKYISRATQDRSSSHLSLLVRAQGILKPDKEAKTLSYLLLDAV